MLLATANHRRSSKTRWRRDEAQAARKCSKDTASTSFSMEGYSSKNESINVIHESFVVVDNKFIVTNATTYNLLNMLSRKSKLNQIKLQIYSMFIIIHFNSFTDCFKMLQWLRPPHMEPDTACMLFLSYSIMTIYYYYYYAHSLLLFVFTVLLTTAHLPWIAPQGQIGFWIELNWVEIFIKYQTNRFGI